MIRHLGISVWNINYEILKNWSNILNFDTRTRSMLFAASHRNARCKPIRGSAYRDLSNTHFDYHIVTKAEYCDKMLSASMGYWRCLVHMKGILNRDARNTVLLNTEFSVNLAETPNIQGLFWSIFSYSQQVFTYFVADRSVWPASSKGDVHHLRIDLIITYDLIICLSQIKQKRNIFTNRYIII